MATIPTASLRVRAARLVDSIAELVDAQGGTVSVIGHSSGGLDARLVVTPDVSLPSPRDVERYARAVRSVVTVSAPHHGTPVAHLFNSLLGQQLLRLLSVLTIYVIRAGRLPIGVGLRVARLLRRGQRRRAASSSSSCTSSSPTSRATGASRSSRSSRASARIRSSSGRSRPARWTCSTPPRRIARACATAAS